MSYPLDISRVALTVHDLPGMRDFYQSALGLALLSGDGESAVLGAGDTALLELRRDAHARPAARSEAGLFHTAFLLPERADLARWLRHAAGRGVRLQGASDHAVSEALYLADPEGNGIEIYVDRPEESWERKGDRIRMVTEALDLDDLLRLPGEWHGAPQGTRIGHLHLATSDLDAARSFITGLGMVETMAGRGGAWFGAGDYHHQLAANTWGSQGAGPRRFPVTGLAEYEVMAQAPSALPAGEGVDMDGTPIRITRV